MGTEVDDDGKYIGKFARCKGSTKTSCHQLHLLTTDAGQQERYGEFTTANTGCPCWFDLTRSDCACCTDDGVQCGNPLQQWCTSRAEGRQAGCLGIPQNQRMRPTARQPLETVSGSTVATAKRIVSLTSSLGPTMNITSVSASQDGLVMVFSALT